MRKLSPTKCKQVIDVVSAGCPLETAAHYVGCPMEQLRETIQKDAKFSRDVTRAQAAVEFEHMRKIKNEGCEEGNWRASVWWLEALAPGRYKPREEDRLTRGETRRLLERVIRAVSTNVSHEEDRERLLAELDRLAAQAYDPTAAPEGNANLNTERKQQE